MVIVWITQVRLSFRMYFLNASVFCLSFFFMTKCLHTHTAPILKKPSCYRWPRWGAPIWRWRALRADSSSTCSNPRYPQRSKYTRSKIFVYLARNNDTAELMTALKTTYKCTNFDFVPHYNENKDFKTNFITFASGRVHGRKGSSRFRHPLVKSIL